MGEFRENRSDTGAIEWQGYGMMSSPADAPREPSSAFAPIKTPPMPLAPPGPGVIIVSLVLIGAVPFETNP
jgi:hypothetical protein